MLDMKYLFNLHCFSILIFESKGSFYNLETFAGVATRGPRRLFQWDRPQSVTDSLLHFF